MTILVVGASGKTGRRVVEQLLAKNLLVRVVVRSSHRLPAEVCENPNTAGSTADATDIQLTSSTTPMTV